MRMVGRGLGRGEGREAGKGPDMEIRAPTGEERVSPLTR